MNSPVGKLYQNQNTIRYFSASEAQARRKICCQCLLPPGAIFLVTRSPWPMADFSWGFTSLNPELNEKMKAGLDPTTIITALRYFVEILIGEQKQYILLDDWRLYLEGKTVALFTPEDEETQDGEDRRSENVPGIHP